MQEGKHAIESPSSPTAPDLGPEFYLIGEFVSITLHSCQFIL